MNPITLMLLTVVANALVTGIIVYLIQKRIERSYTRQLEEFRANIQYLLFEQQTKFSRVFPKTLDVIETFHQKYRHYAELSSQFANDIILFLAIEELTDEELREAKSLKRITDEELDKKQTEVSSALDDLSFYLRNNRIYLPDKSVREFEDISDKADTLRGLLKLFRYLHDMSLSAKRYFATMLDDAEKEGLSIKNINLEDGKHAVSEYAEQMHIELNKLSVRLEEHYKSVAATTKQGNQ